MLTGPEEESAEVFESPEWFDGSGVSIYAVLERRLGGKKVRFRRPDRVLLAALLCRPGSQALRGMRLPVGPGTVLRWHRDPVRGRHAARSGPRRPGRPRTVRSTRALVLRLVREKPRLGVPARAR